MYNNKPGRGRVAFGVLGGIMSIIVGITFILSFLSDDSFEDSGVVVSILCSILGVFLLAAALNDIISLFSQKYKAFSENIELTHSALPVIEIVMLSISCLIMFAAMIYVFDEEFLYEFGEEGAFIVAIILILTVIDTIMIIVSKGKLLQNKNTYNPYYPQQGGYNNPNQPMYGYGNNYQQSNGVQNPYGNNYQQSNGVQNPYGNNYQQSNGVQNPYGNNYQQSNGVQNSYGNNYQQSNEVQNPYGNNYQQSNGVQNSYGNNYQQSNGVQNPYGNNYQQQSGNDNSYSESVNKVSLNKNTYDSFNGGNNGSGY